MISTQIKENGNVIGYISIQQRTKNKYIYYYDSYVENKTYTGIIVHHKEEGIINLHRKVLDRISLTQRRENAK